MASPWCGPNGTVIVPIANANETAIGAFNSTNGGASWSAVTTIATIRHHTVAGCLREGPLPSAEIDGAGTVYVAWADCRFRRACKTNDIVVSHSLNATGTSWSAVSRVPIDGTNSGIDHFIPGLAVNKATSGGTAQLGLTYYFYPSKQHAAQRRVYLLDECWQHVEPSRRRSPAACRRRGSRPPARAVWSATISRPRTAATTWRMVCSRRPARRPAGPPAAASPDNCREPTATFVSGLAAGGSASSAADEVLFGGNGNADADSLWNVVDNNGSKHRD